MPIDLSQMAGGSDDQDMDSDPSQDSGMDDIQKSGKLMALHQLLGDIADLADEDLRPFIETARNSLPSSMDQDQSGMGDDSGQDQSMDDGSGDMSTESPDGLQVSIGTGSPDEMDHSEPDGDESEDDDSKPGLLAILAARRKSAAPKM
jgi:hypothetical protein